MFFPRKKNVIRVLSSLQMIMYCLCMLFQVNKKWFVRLLSILNLGFDRFREFKSEVNDRYVEGLTNLSISFYFRCCKDVSKSFEAIRFFLKNWHISTFFYKKKKILFLSSCVQIKVIKASHHINIFIALHE